MKTLYILMVSGLLLFASGNVYAGLAEIRAYCVKHKARVNAFHEKIDKLIDEAKDNENDEDTISKYLSDSQFLFLQVIFNMFSSQNTNNGKNKKNNNNTNSNDNNQISR